MAQQIFQEVLGHEGRKINHVCSYDLINKSDVQIFRFCGHTMRLSKIWLIRPSKNWLESDMADSPNFFSSEIRGDRFTDFCVHTARFLGNPLKNVI